MAAFQYFFNSGVKDFQKVLRGQLLIKKQQDIGGLINAVG